MMNVLSLAFQSKAIKLSLSFPLIERSRWDTEGYLVLRRQTCVFLAPSHSSSEPTVANRMYLPSELCAITSTQCPEVLLAPTNASAAPSRRAERDTECYLMVSKLHV